MIIFPALLATIITLAVNRFFSLIDNKRKIMDEKLNHVQQLLVLIRQNSADLKFLQHQHQLIDIEAAQKTIYMNQLLFLPYEGSPLIGFNESINVLIDSYNDFLTKLINTIKFNNNKYFLFIEVILKYLLYIIEKCQNLIS